MENNVLTTFCRRLDKIGIKAKLSSNVPWIYLRSVNGKPVKGVYMSKNCFTAFFHATRVSDTFKYKFSDRRLVFKKVRETLENKT